MSRAIVLLSGGQDSATCLFWARTVYDEVEAISFRYGQRHAAELEAGARIADLAGVKRTVFDLGVLSQLGDSALVNAGEAIKVAGGRGDAQVAGGLPTSFVPGRNLLMLSVAGAYAVKVGARDVVAGVCQADYSGYPDCRRAFVDSLEATLALAMPSESGPFRIVTPLMHLTKAETVRLARRLGADCWRALGHTITCYEGRRPGCGECPACAVRARGFEEAGEIDPTS